MVDLASGEELPQEIYGAVIGLEKQKLTEGKDLIKYFKKGTKTAVSGRIENDN